MPGTTLSRSSLDPARLKLAAAGADDHQKAELVQVVLANVCFHPPDAKDAALDQRRTAEEVERKHAQLGPVRRSLA